MKPASLAGGLVLGLLCLLMGCGRRELATPVEEWEPPESLSAFGLFLGTGATQEPAAGVVPYDLNTPLFSDFASKRRFIRLPEGTSAAYDATDEFAFPDGTVIAKTFSYSLDAKDATRGELLIETRLLIRRPEGWVGMAYEWNAEQTEATLRLAGKTREVHWRDDQGQERTLSYLIPNVNQCKGCHENEKVLRPIGPKARHLNREYVYPTGPENQLSHWSKLGILRDAPAPGEAPRSAVWNDASTGSLEARARAWLEINCAHCHNPHGPAKTSGLDLRVAQTDPAKWGVWKTPIAAGRGSGGRSYDIVPGKPDESILLYRLTSTEPGVMMPELGRRLTDATAVALVRDWIANLPPRPR